MDERQPTYGRRVVDEVKPLPETGGVFYEVHTHIDYSQPVISDETREYILTHAAPEDYVLYRRVIDKLNGGVALTKKK